MKTRSLRNLALLLFPIALGALSTACFFPIKNKLNPALAEAEKEVKACGVRRQETISTVKADTTAPAVDMTGKWSCYLPAHEATEWWTVTQTGADVSIQGRDNYGNYHSQKGKLAGTTFRDNGGGLVLEVGETLSGIYREGDQSGCIEYEIACERR